ncbi:hypothetical protein FHR83_001834 [Actinoplanes campanulatus]|uniref:Uncharacterized protein n=1 Tax=Actinoplanes campanulatus TaxID=113559 RepID=A0A7W5FDD4_9ACTN|nr:DUF6529 family protein [Actinoplanes campanulatus]MBB3094182.1 hypothetical protein [Actinoplanes campanulatus]GGN43255.1 hypothetical protein GCM10010109_75200 [Actinoplanes campanulatus]GID35898.1 hypothetical protein Aca09nite_24040 [Actinoplanes campanulatus]
MPTATPLRPRVWLPLVAGVGVAVVLGVYGRLHEPVGTTDVLGFLRLQTAKVWLATGVGILAFVQVVSAAVIYRPRPAPGWVAGLHRWNGRLALLLSVPVAVHCLYRFGLRFDTPRVLAHSLLGCLFYGAFATKMLLLSRPGRGSGWALPVAGGVVLTAVAGLWLTSALWFFATIGVSW